MEFREKKNREKKTNFKALNDRVHVASVAKVLQAGRHVHGLAQLVLVHVLQKK